MLKLFIKQTFREFSCHYLHITHVTVLFYVTRVGEGDEAFPVTCPIEISLVLMCLIISQNIAESLRKLAIYNGETVVWTRVLLLLVTTGQWCDIRISTCVTRGPGGSHYYRGQPIRALAGQPLHYRKKSIVEDHVMCSVSMFITLLDFVVVELLQRLPNEPY